MILVDTSVWLDYLRQRDNPQTQNLRAHLASNTEIVTCTPVLQEVLQGAKSNADFSRLQRVMGAMPLIEPAHPAQCAVAAARTFAKCRWHGVTLRSPLDCLIAQIAIDNNAILFHHDRDFEQIHEVAPALTHRHFLPNAQ